LRKNKVQVIKDQTREILLSIDARTSSVMVKCGSSAVPEPRRQIPVDSPDPPPGVSITYLPYNTLKLPSMNSDLERRRTSVSPTAASLSFARRRQRGFTGPTQHDHAPWTKGAPLSIFIATRRGRRGLGKETGGIFGFEPQQPRFVAPSVTKVKNPTGWSHCFSGPQRTRHI
jgi:hypothetical protein